MADNRIQGEKMEAYRIDSGELQPRSFADWDWEEDAQMAWRGAQPGDQLTLRFKSPKAIPDANLELQLTQSKGKTPRLPIMSLAWIT